MPKRKPPQAVLDEETEDDMSLHSHYKYKKVYNSIYADLDDAEEQELFNPSGVTRPVFYD